MRYAGKCAAALSFFIILPDVIGQGITIPVVPAIVQELTGGGPSRASEYGGGLTFAYASPRFGFAPVVGGLSDKLGRRPGLDCTLLVVAPTVAWRFVGHLVAGITGASFATSYVAASGPPEKRPRNFGLPRQCAAAAGRARRRTAAGSSFAVHAQPLAPAPPAMSDSTPLHQTSFRPDLNVLIGRWGYQPTPAELPPVYDELREAALRTGCGFWLQDIRRRTLNDPAITQWLLAEFFPQMARELGSRLCVAYLVSPTLHQHILAETGYVPPTAYVDRPFIIDFFGDEGAATQWLREQQA